MIETTAVFLGGVVFGALVLIAIKEVYDWISGLSDRVTRLRQELRYFTNEIELWHEFHDWKRMTKKEKQ